MLPLTGYTNRLSVTPGETIDFKISSVSSQPYQARLVKVLCGDPNPAGPGIQEQSIDVDFAGSYPSRLQTVPLGSYARINNARVLNELSSFTLIATIWPTLPEQDQQTVIARYQPDQSNGFALAINQQGANAVIAMNVEQTIQVSVGKPLRERTWYRIWASYDATRKTLSVGQFPLQPAFMVDDGGLQTAQLDFDVRWDNDEPLLIAALGGTPVTGHYNGKIEQPMIIGQALSEAVIREYKIDNDAENLMAYWDFSQEMASKRIVDQGPHSLHGELVNLPARAMKGSNWDASEMSWQHAPEQYGAIHFHDDDIYDCEWETDFSFTVPDDFKSGVYAARLSCDDSEEMIPFFVRPKSGQPQSKVCVLIPTFTYTVYANFQRHNTDDEYRARAAQWGARPWTADDHPDYGLSTYNFHRDGSGICYSSRLRPVINMRSSLLAYVDPRGSGLRHFPADTHLFYWLEKTGHDYDVITDEDLDAEGLALLKSYKTVLTTTHPEYHTPNTLDALSQYTQQHGGRLIYLGGNGFYWKVAINADYPGAVEIRRGEGGIRAWAADPGEYYNSFDGQYGGMWRRNDRPPQLLAGVGFTSQGFFDGSYYRRQAGADDPRAAWIFDGVDDEILGDFGLSGGGAAGFELDRLDYRLGTPPNALLLARSEKHNPELFVVVPEELLTHFSTWPGEPPDQLVRSDMVYFETAHGGAVFSVGSITFCGSLLHNNCDNNISKIINNVLTRFGSD